MRESRLVTATVVDENLAGHAIRPISRGDAAVMRLRHGGGRHTEEKHEEETKPRFMTRAER